MKLAKIVVGCLALTMLLLAVSGNSAAGVSTIGPNASHTEKLKVDSGELLVFWWTSSSSLHFVMKDSDGTTLVDVTASSYTYDTPMLATPGTYTLKWTNDGTTSSVLNFSSPFQDIGHAFDMLFWGLLIGGIALVAVVVLVVVLVVKKKKSPAPSPGWMPPIPPQYAAQVAATGKCPMCGMPVDPQGLFCAKCGAKLR